MIRFQVKNHQEISEDCQGINLTKFSFNNNHETENEILLLNFITSRSYTHVSLKDVVKAEPELEFLRQAFVTDLLEVEDFKKLSKKQLDEYLIEFSRTEDWGEDKNDFEILMQKFHGILSSINSDIFYVINIDWFEKGNRKVRQPENGIYGYYFLIIWIDNNVNEIGVAEWSMD